MSNRQRIGFGAVALLIAIVAVVFVLASDDTSERADEPGERAQRGAAAEPGTGAQRGQRTAPGADADNRGEGSPAEPQVQRIALEGGQVSGGPQDVTVTSGEQVTLVVTSDGPDEIHVHGYDLTQDTAPGEPARFTFEANIEGSFEIESHTAEDAGLGPLIANLVVEPS